MQNLSCSRNLDIISVSATIEDKNLIVGFITPDDQSEITNTESSSSFATQGDNSVFCYVAENTLVVTIQKTEMKAGAIHLKIEGASAGKSHHYLDIVQDDQNWIARIQGGVIRQTGDRFMLISSEEITHFIIEPAGDNSVSMFGVAPTSFTIVQADDKPVEFSVSIYDDPERKRLRHVRFGAPVISTVPVSGPGLTDPNEAAYVHQMIEEGIGSEYRTMYFRVFSSRRLNAITPPNLYIFLPGGLDTVNNQIVIPLVAEVLASPNFNQDYSVFTGEYNFYREDAVTFVDGYAYFGVYLQPVKIYSGLSLTVKTNATGTPFRLASFDDPWKY